MHPREGWSADGRPPDGRLAIFGGTGPVRRPAVSRRGFLTRAAGAALAATGVGGALDACGSVSAATGKQQKVIPLPRPTSPVTWPIFAGNKPIAGGLLPERRATLKIFNWVSYVSQQCLDNFARKYHCQVELTTFSTMSQALRELGSGKIHADLCMGVTVDVLGELVESQIIQPLNHSYLPNITQAWPEFSDPYYDAGWRYTVPYTVYTTGIAWRKDFVPQDPYLASNGWAFPWQARYRGRVAILDDYREAISLGLLTSGITELNTNDPMQILTGQQALQNLAELTGMRIDNYDNSDIASGRSWIHHAWSGDIAAAASYLPKGVPVNVIGYWFPADGVGPVASDTNTVLRGARNPVLAHLFLNYMLDPANALTNIRHNGYMQPLNFITPKRLVYQGILPRSLLSTAVLPTYFGHGLKELALPPATDQLWQHAWRAVTRLA
jgi:spermidine/putrescine transport system substrate-binding protein